MINQINVYNKYLINDLNNLSFIIVITILMLRTVSFGTLFKQQYNYMCGVLPKKLASCTFLRFRAYIHILSISTSKNYKKKKKNEKDNNIKDEDLWNGIVFYFPLNWSICKYLCIMHTISIYTNTLYEMMNAFRLIWILIPQI